MNQRKFTKHYKQDRSLSAYIIVDLPGANELRLIPTDQDGGSNAFNA